MSGLLTTFAPPFKLIGSYFIVGLVALLLSIGGYFLADFNLLLAFPTAGFFHLFLVGFVMSIIIGALYQLTSVILEKDFFTIKFAIPNLVIYVVSILLFCVGFFTQNVGMMHGGGALLYLSLLYFIVCFLLSFKGAKVRTYAYFMLFTAGVYLFAGITVGFLLLFVVVGVISFDFILLLHYHIYLVLGFIYFVILGASSVLVPMFALSHKVSFRLYYTATGLYLAAGLVLAYDYRVSLIWIGLSVVGFIGQIYLILRKRVRKAYDYWNVNIIVSFVFLITAGILYKCGHNASSFVLFYGFLYAFIVGHLYKIAPFLIWYHYISPFVGKKKVPMLEDMIVKKIAYISVVFNAFAIFFVVVYLESLALFSMVISVLLLLYNMINIFKFIKFGENNG
ncbi:MAG: peptidase M50 [Campylobacter sp.]|nr:peptidase M50 [Campylobacter sp.]